MKGKRAKEDEVRTGRGEKEFTWGNEYVKLFFIFYPSY